MGTIHGPFFLCNITGSVRIAVPSRFDTVACGNCGYSSNTGRRCFYDGCDFHRLGRFHSSVAFLPYYRAAAVTAFPLPVTTDGGHNSRSHPQMLISVNIPSLPCCCGAPSATGSRIGANGLAPKSASCCSSSSFMPAAINLIRFLSHTHRARQDVLIDTSGGALGLLFSGCCNSVGNQRGRSKIPALSIQLLLPPR